MRNPWGHAKYNGPYNLADNKRWTPAVKAQLGHSAENTGLFWMPVSLFKRSFNEYIVCMYQEWNVSRTEYKQKSQSNKYYLKSNQD